MEALLATNRMNRGRIPRPFLKWVGGKTQLLQDLIRCAPSFRGQYLEPFVGGGALFYELLPRRARLSDLNRELIDCYTAVRDQVEAVILALQVHRYEKSYYYEVRDVDPWELGAAERAARMIFLNKTGFNGLYRVNSRGNFNVPFGRYKNPRICHTENLRACAEALQGVKLGCESFEAVLKHARKGDFVYFDPPYVPLSNTANFTAYEKSGFGMSNQEKLAEVFDRLDHMGVFVMLSNSDVPWIHEHYAGHRIRTVMARRSVNSNTRKRGFVGEVVVTNY